MSTQYLRIKVSHLDLYYQSFLAQKVVSECIVALKSQISAYKGSLIPETTSVDVVGLLGKSIYSFYNTQGNLFKKPQGYFLLQGTVSYRQIPRGGTTIKTYEKEAQALWLGASPENTELKGKPRVTPKKELNKEVLLPSWLVKLNAHCAKIQEYGLSQASPLKKQVGNVRGGEMKVKSYTLLPSELPVLFYDWLASHVISTSTFQRLETLTVPSFYDSRKIVGSVAIESYRKKLITGEVVVGSRLKNPATSPYVAVGTLHKSDIPEGSEYSRKGEPVRAQLENLSSEELQAFRNIYV